MKTLTIAAAKKNLGRLLQAAAKGEDIGIISGADIIALRKVEVESSDYGQREYGVSVGELAKVEHEADRRYRKLKKTGVLRITGRAELMQLAENPR